MPDVYDSSGENIPAGRPEDRIEITASGIRAAMEALYNHDLEISPASMEQTASAVVTVLEAAIGESIPGCVLIVP